MDALDRKALPLLMANGRITWSDLGQALGLSAPAAAERVRKLEEHGVIRGYSAIRACARSARNGRAERSVAVARQ